MKYVYLYSELLKYVSSHKIAHFIMYDLILMRSSFPLKQIDVREAISDIVLSPFYVWWNKHGHLQLRSLSVREK